MTWAYEISCRAPNCTVSVRYVPGTQSAFDTNELLEAHLKAHPDSDHVMSQPRAFWSEMVWPMPIPAAARNLVFRQTMRCLEGDFSLDAGEDVGQEEHDQADKHCTDNPGHKIIVEGRYVEG